MENKIIVIDEVEYLCTPIEKKVDNGFEIQSFRIKSSGSLLYLKPSGWYGFLDNAANYPLEDCLKSHNDEIYSVKRTSDGEIFTVGDKITGTMSFDESPSRLGYTTIKGFYLEDDKLCIEISTGVIRNYEYSDLAINTISKYVEKPVLFTTEDGVAISVGEASYGVDKTTNKYMGTYIWPKLEYFGKDSLSADIKYFSTEERAKNYIYSHEKKYSRQEILDVLKDVEDEDIVHGGVEEIIKKLNL
jgi:hypothetical protein